MGFETNCVMHFFFPVPSSGLQQASRHTNEITKLRWQSHFYDENLQAGCKIKTRVISIFHLRFIETTQISDDHKL